MTDFKELVKDLQLCRDSIIPSNFPYPYDANTMLSKAIDAIKVLNARAIFLEAAFDALDHMAKREWIPVEDHLPDEKTEVEIYCKNGAMFFAQYWRGYDGELHWTTCGPLGSGRRVATNRVTHWKPKPEPPEENGKCP